MSWRQWGTTSGRWRRRSLSSSPATTCCCCLSRTASGARLLAGSTASVALLFSGCAIQMLPCHLGFLPVCCEKPPTALGRYEALVGSSRGRAASRAQRNQQGGRNSKPRPPQHPVTMADLVTHFVRLHGEPPWHCCTCLVISCRPAVKAACTVMRIPGTDCKLLSTALANFLCLLQAFFSPASMSTPFPPSPPQPRQSCSERCRCGTTLSCHPCRRYNMPTGITSCNLVEA